MFLRLLQALVFLSALLNISCAESEELWFNDQTAPRTIAMRDASLTNPTCESYGKLTRVSTVTPRLDEISGLVVSRVYPDIIWAHNDSGDGANLYAIRISTGELVSIVRLIDVKAYDWEDIAIAPCDEGWCLFIGDIGDNRGRRETIEIHRLPEPDPFGGDLQLVEVQTMQGSLSDGPHDAEALFAVDNDLYILSKANGVSHLYHAPFQAGTGATFRRRGIIEWNQRTARGRAFLTTGADYESNPPRLIVRGYFAMVEFVGEEGEDIETLLQRRARVVPAGSDLQGEAVGYAPNGYYHAAEWNNAPLWFVGCGADEPQPEPEPEPEPEPCDDTEERQDDGSCATSESEPSE